MWKRDHLPPGFGTTAGHTLVDKVTSINRDLARHARGAVNQVVSPFVFYLPHTILICSLSFPQILSKTSFAENETVVPIPQLGDILIRVSFDLPKSQIHLN